MPISLDEHMMRSIIMDHFSNPRHRHVPNDLSSYIQIHKDSENCIDDITLYIEIEGNVVKDALFDGVACTITASSTDIMCDLVIGKTIEEAKSILESYFNMIFEKPFDSDILDEANAFKNTHKQAARIKCATIGWNALKEAIEQDGK